MLRLALAIYKLIHWFCQKCNDRVGPLLQKNKDLTKAALPDSKSITDIVSESLGKVVEQFNAAMKDTRDYIKKHLKRLFMLQQLLEWIHLLKAYKEAYQSHPVHLMQLRWLMSTVKEKSAKAFFIIFLNPQVIHLNYTIQDTKLIAELLEAEFDLPNIKIQKIACLGIPRPGLRLLLVELNNFSTDKKNYFKATNQQFTYLQT